MWYGLSVAAKDGTRLMQALVNKQTLEAIITTRSVWQTPGEYRMPCYAVIQFDCPDDQELDSVQDIGPVSQHEPGDVYLSPSVTLKKRVLI